MKSRLLFWIILFPILGFSQSEVTINAYVLDGATNQPIPFANIGFVELGVGTVSNDQGKFKLTFDEDQVGLQGEMQISTLGYQTKTIKLFRLYDLLEANNIIYLNPVAYNLDEVFITNQKREDVVLGSSKMNPELMGYWKDKKGLGGEIASRLRVRVPQTQLKDLSFYIIENSSDSLLVRVNVYDYYKRYPGKNLLTQNILYTIKQQSGPVTIPLDDYSIYVNDDVVISIELIQVYGDEIGFAIASSAARGVAYTRSLSQDKWERFSTLGMGLFVNASQPEQTNSEQIVRDRPQLLQLYWDNSLSMKNRNFQEEFDLLEAYLKELDKPKVALTEFSAAGTSTKVFECDRNCSDLMDYLQSITYTGGSDFGSILQENPFKADAILLFSDGNSIYNFPQTRLNLPIFAVNSLKTANHVALQDLSLFADGHYIDLSRINGQEALGLMLNQIDDNTVYSEEITLRDQVTGIVSSSSGPLQGAQVWVKGTYEQVLTNADGEFSVAAEQDQVLSVNFLGMLPKDVLITQTNDLNIVLEPDGQLLDEVLIEANKEEDEVITPFGKKSRNALGFAVDFILSEDIPPYYTNLAQLLAGRAGIQVVGFGDDAQFVFTRSIASSISNASLPIIVVDGIVYEQDQRPFIDIQNIDNVAIFRGLQAVNRYGTIATYGAIRIETKTFALSGEPAAKKESALVTGNDYTDVLIPDLDSGVAIPDYLRELYGAGSFNEAKNIYYTQQQKAGFRDIPYFINVSSYFEEWDTAFAFGVLSAIAELAPDNVKALRVLAFTLEERGLEEKTLPVYERIRELQPKHVQSYRDLALAYQYAGKYQEALDVYKNLLSGNYPGVEISGLVQVIENELQHLVAFHRDKVSYKDLPNSLLKTEFNYDLRFVFEWTDPNLEFDLQFVNPQNKYFKWTHSPFEDKERMLEEIVQGFSTEEFILDDNPSGKWLVNIEYLGKEPLVNPTYLKYTVYTNYGLPNESKTVKLVNITQQAGKVTLDSFVY